MLECEAVTDIDVTAAAMLEQLDQQLNEQGVHLAFVELRSRLQDLVLRYGLFETLDRDHFYPSVEAALAAIAAADAAATVATPAEPPRPGPEGAVDHWVATLRDVVSRTVRRADCPVLAPEASAYGSSRSVPARLPGPASPGRSWSWMSSGLLEVDEPVRTGRASCTR